MKILHVMPYTPVPPNFGGALRIYNLLKQMTKQHEVTVVFPGSERNVHDIQTHFNGNLRVVRVPLKRSAKFRRTSQLISLLSSHSFMYRLGRHDNIQLVINEELEKHDYSVVQTEFPHMATYDIPVDVLKILDAHNIEYDNFRRIWQKSTHPLQRLHYYDEYRKVYGEELAAFRRNDLVLFTSDRDRDLVADKITGTLQSVIPNGVDCSYFTPDDSDREPYSLVFSGIMKYIPNHDGVVYFLDEVFPLIEKELPAVKFYIVGSSPPAHLLKRRRENVVVTGFVPDVRPFLNRATVGVIPLRMGSGTRLKLLELLSMKIPVVSTAIGAEGIEVVGGESALIADEPRAFAEAVVRLLRDEALRKKLSRNGHDLVKQKYEWTVIGEKLSDVYEKTLADRVRGVPVHE